MQVYKWGTFALIADSFGNKFLAKTSTSYKEYIILDSTFTYSAPLDDPAYAKISISDTPLSSFNFYLRIAIPTWNNTKFTSDIISRPFIRFKSLDGSYFGISCESNNTNSGDIPFSFVKYTNGTLSRISDIFSGLFAILNVNTYNLSNVNIYVSGIGSSNGIIQLFVNDFLFKKFSVDLTGLGTISEFAVAAVTRDNEYTPIQQTVLGAAAISDKLLLGCQLTCLRPSSQGTYKDWSLTSISDLSTYPPVLGKGASSNTDGGKFTLNFLGANINDSTDKLIGLKLFTNPANTIDGKAATLTPIVRSSGNDTLLPNVSVNNYLSQVNIDLPVSNPATGKQWLNSELSAAEFGFIGNIKDE